MSPRLRRIAPRFLFLLIAIAPACGGGGSDGGGEPPEADVRLETVASGLDFPLDLTAPRTDRSRLFVAEKTGRIRVIREGALLATPFLDLSSRVSNGSEQGLLALAFHPDYETNGRFFVNFTDLAGDTRILGFRVSGNPDVADPTSETELLFVDQPFPNHNGGTLAFGPDGFLYVALGDGGGAGDPNDNAQNRASLLGKILRIDVDGAAPYSIPSSNPFAGMAGARGEVWSFGLRNPFRASFDRLTGDLYIGDVGQSEREEIDVQRRSSAGGENYGWNVTEGSLCFRASDCDTAGFTPPVLDYGHDEGCSVAGGHVYRGAAIPALRGQYFYGDFCSSFVRSFRFDGGGAAERREWPSLSPPGMLTSFGEDTAGELYVLSSSGGVFRIVSEE